MEEVLFETLGGRQQTRKKAEKNYVKFIMSLMEHKLLRLSMSAIFRTECGKIQSVFMDER